MWRRLIGRAQADRRIDAELQFHVDEEAARLAAEGVPAGEARRRALASFGGLAPIRERTQDARGTRWLDDLWRDTHQAVRLLRRSPIFTLTAVVSLAIGIGANAALFSVADALILRPLPVDRPEELSFLNRAGYEQRNLRFAYPTYEAAVRAAPEARLAAMSSTARMQVRIGGSAELVIGQLVTGNWFDVVGVRPAAGRLLTDGDQAAGRDGVVVLGHDLWTSRFGGRLDAIGAMLPVNGVPLTIVGVAPRGFRGLAVGERSDLWLPVTLQPAVRYFANAAIDDADETKPWVTQEGIAWLSLILRTPKTASITAVEAKLDAVRQQVRDRRIANARTPEQKAFLARERLALIPGAHGLSDVREDFTAPLRVLMATVAIVLLIGCANLASLLLARGAARGREIALRLSLGAGRGRVVRQLLTESLVLAGLGGALGIHVAYWGGHALVRQASSGPAAIPLDLRLDGRLLLFTLGISLVTGLLFGLMPALRLSRTDLTDAMRSGGRIAGAGDSLGALPAGKVLVAVQVALSLTLLVGTMLFLRTFRNLALADTGFARDAVVTARFDPRLAQIDADALPALYERLLARGREVPGARQAALALSGAVTGSARVSNIVIDNEPSRPGSDADVREDFVTEDYFAAMDMPIVGGRALTARDDMRAAKVVVINETLARHFFGDRNPIGHRLGYERPAALEIVGIVRDAHIDGLREPVPPMVYYPLRQSPGEFARNLYIRMDSADLAIKPAVQRAVNDAEPNLAVREVVTVAELSNRTIARERLVSRLTGAFAVLALLVASLGLYGTVSYSVSRRTTEIGVRIALGAAPGGVRWLILRETLLVVVLGAVVGVGLSLAVSGLLQTLVYGLSPRDPWAIAAATGAMTALGVTAGLIPAWRASRVDPIRALRD